MSLIEVFRVLTKNWENYGGGKIENVDLHPTPPYTPGPGPGTRALGNREGWGANPHFGEPAEPPESLFAERAHIKCTLPYGKAEVKHHIQIAHC